MKPNVTGIGSGKNSEHISLGVSHLIGPRMDEEKAKLVSSYVTLVELYAKIMETHTKLIEKFVLEK